MNPDSIKSTTVAKDEGLTSLRDHYAGLAMQEHMRALSAAKTEPGETWSGVVAALSYQMADAMIAARG